MFKNPTHNSLAFILIVLVAIVDGILVADHFYAKSPNTSTIEPVTSDITETIEVTAPPVVVPVKSVPFITQAPLGIWKSPWTEYAEEACVYMAYKWANNEGVSTQKIASDDLYGIGLWENEQFGSSKLTDASQTLQILKEYLGHTKATLSYDLGAEDIKMLLDQDMVMIVPVNGGLLLNPHYGKPAPEHHMVLIYDYDETTFITNDPGTLYGEAYAYNQTALLNSIQDLNGDKVMIVVGR
ncbi:MAG: hypothetical protein WC897_00450 [Candidatus Gracilibacteria bacterium]